LLEELSLELKLPEPVLPLVPLAVAVKLPDPLAFRVTLLEPVESETWTSKYSEWLYDAEAFKFKLPATSL
jgi:hypothetical protein